MFECAFKHFISQLSFACIACIIKGDDSLFNLGLRFTLCVITTFESMNFASFFCVLFWKED